MKTKTFYIFLSVIFFLVLTACEKENPLAYENDPALYFFKVAPNVSGQKDSLEHTFFFATDNVVRDTVYVILATMGDLSDKERPISIVQTNKGELNAAEAGIHYVAFDDPEVAKYMMVPAGHPRAVIPIIILRDKSLETSVKSLKLTVVRNEYFRPGIAKQTDFIVKTTAAAVKPKFWDTAYRYVLGLSWGPAKMKLLVDATGYTDWDNVPDMAYINYMKALAKNALKKYNDAHVDAPLSEADGTLVSFDS